MMKGKQSLVNHWRARVGGAGLLALTIIGLAMNPLVIAGQAFLSAAFPSLHISLRDSSRTERQYFAALRAADSTTFQNEFAAEFLLLLEKRLRQTYDSLATIEERKAFIEYYWKARNPDPLLPENEWLLDHLRRREYARQNFIAGTPPYFDDRGKYYIKYGRPVIRFEDPGGLRRVSFFSPETYRAVQGQYSYKGGPEEHYMAMANESWSYPNVARDFVVHFVKDGPAFREVESLTAALASHQRKNLAWQWSDLVKQRAAISPFLGRAAQQIEQFESAVTSAAANPRRPGLLRAEVQSFNERLMEVARASEHEAGKARSGLPPSVHEPVKAVNRLAFQEAIAQFRGPQGNTRVEITFLAPLKKNFVDQLDSLSIDTIAVEFAWMLRDHNLDSLAAKRWQNTFPAKWAAAENLPNAVGRLSFLSPPQQVELVLQVQSRRLDKLGYAKETLAIRDFRGDALMLSDVQFLTEVANANQRQILPAFTKLNTAVAPYPFEKIQKTIPLLCYFEIYNLKSSGITDNYEVVYKVISEKSGDKNIAVSVSYTRPVTDDTAPELIGIDLRQVPKGAHRLEITVAAMNNRNITANIQKAIRIDD